MHYSIPTLLASALFGYCLCWSAQLACRHQGASRQVNITDGIQLIGWLFMLASCIGLLWATGAVGDGAYLVLLLATVLAIECVHLLWHLRADDQRILIETMAVAMKRGIPLPTLARAFASERSDAVGRRSLVLATRLEQGLSLAKAMHRAGLAYDEETLLVCLALESSNNGNLRTGEATVALPATTNPNLLQTTIQDSPSSVLIAKWCQVGQAAALASLAWFCLYKSCHGVLQVLSKELANAKGLDPDSVPVGSNVSVLEENVSLFSWRVQWIQSLADAEFVAWMAPLWLIPVGLVLLVLLVLACGFFFPINRRLAPFSWWMFRLDSARVLRAMSLVLERQASLLGAIRKWRDDHQFRYFRHKLAQAERELVAGRDWRVALERVGMLRTAEVQELQAAERCGTLTSTLRAVANQQETRWTNRILVTQNAFIYLSKVVAGICVLINGMVLVWALTEMIFATL